jgi:hypothetical protein
MRLPLGARSRVADHERDGFQAGARTLLKIGFFAAHIDRRPGIEQNRTRERTQENQQRRRHDQLDQCVSSVTGRRL